MKRKWLILCCICTLYGYAQQGTMIGDVDTENFPKVSFFWNEYNPDILTVNHFTLKENGKDVPFVIENLPVTSIPQKNKTILILWEDQPVRKNQFDFTQQLLYYFLAEDITNDVSTTFNIAIFNRRQGDDPVLNTKLSQFTSDKAVLSEFIIQYDDNTRQAAHNNARYRTWNNPGESDLFLAIKEGLELIAKEPATNTRAIFVITAGRNYFTPGVEMSPLINQSLLNKIPIYVINYPAFQNVSEAVVRITKETYGRLILSDGSLEEQAKTTRVEFEKSFNELNRRFYGQDYKFSFISKLKRDGLSYLLVLNSNGENYNIMPYSTPDFSFTYWVKQNLIVFLIILVFIVAVLTLGIIFGIRFLKRRKARITNQKQKEERQKAQQLAEQENLKRKLNETREELQRQQRMAEQEKIQVREQEQEERLTKLMITKNLSPKLIIVDEEKIFNINNATTTIGREEDNDIVLSHSTVSKHHAQIVFSGINFELHDLNSSNGSAVNGTFIESAELKSSDIIQLGEVIIKFYL